MINWGEFLICDPGGKVSICPAAICCSLVLPPPCCFPVVTPSGLHFLRQGWKRVSGETDKLWKNSRCETPYTPLQLPHCRLIQAYLLLPLSPPLPHLHPRNSSPFFSSLPLTPCSSTELSGSPITAAAGDGVRFLPEALLSLRREPCGWLTPRRGILPLAACRSVTAALNQGSVLANRRGQQLAAPRPGSLSAYCSLSSPQCASHVFSCVNMLFDQLKPALAKWQKSKNDL